MFRSVESCRAIINKYIGRYGNLSTHEAKELEEAYEDLKEAQRTCSHSFNEFTCFSSKMMQCKYCYLEMDKFD